MKRLALTVGAAIATIAATASAQYYQRPHTYAPDQECWNPRAGHFEGVRPGEVQNDLDFSRCRAMGGRYYGERRYGDSRYYNEPRYYEQPRYKDSWRGFAHECWNPRDERWEVLRPGEIQDSLDRNRCRPYREN